MIVITSFLLLPLLSSVLILSFGENKKYQKYPFLTLTLGQIAAALVFLFNAAEWGVLYKTFGGWAHPFGISFLLDTTSALLLLTSGLVFLAGSLYLLTERGDVDRYRLMLLSFLQIGVNGAFLTADIFNLFVFFEVILISGLVLLISHQTKATRRGAVYYFVLNILASSALLVGIGLTYQQTGVLDFQSLETRFPLVPDLWQKVIGGLFLFCFATKAALFPLYFWLPRAYPMMSGAIGGIFGGLLTKVGLYAILRVFLIIFEPGALIFEIVLAISILSMMFGVLAAFSQKEVRSILSFHIISQVGYIGSGVALTGLAPTTELQRLAAAATLFYFVHHILVKSNLFFAASWMKTVFKSSELSKLSGLIHQFVLLSLLFAVPALSLAGLPPFSGFWAKLGLLKVAFDLGEVTFIFFALAAGLFTFLSMLKIWNLSFLGETMSLESQPRRRHQFLWVAASGLLVVSTLTISLYPDLLFDYCKLAAEQLIAVEKDGSL